jgi:hypothetical protein
MQKLCQPGKNAEKKGQFKGPVEEVVVNSTPIGQKKGKYSY